jgi:hypothetical protein
MTRHGTLAYYLAAWVIGCFIVSLLAWLIAVMAGQPARASLLLTTYFFALVFGAVDALLFAFLLRRLMHWRRTHAVALWLVAGAGVGFALILLLTEANDAWINWNGPLNGTIAFFLSALLAAPDALRHAGFWQVPIEGGGLGVVLCLVDRAFNFPDGRADVRDDGRGDGRAEGRADSRADARSSGEPLPPVPSSSSASTAATTARETKQAPV